MDRKINDLNPILSKIIWLIAAIKSLRFALLMSCPYFVNLSVKSDDAKVLSRIPIPAPLISTTSWESVWSPNCIFQWIWQEINHITYLVIYYILYLDNSCGNKYIYIYMQSVWICSLCIFMLLVFHYGWFHILCIGWWNKCWMSQPNNYAPC